MQYADFMDNCLLTFGEDFLWWGMPVHPELRINYFERVWPKKEIKKMYKTDDFDRKQDHSDPDKKMFQQEVRRSKAEKQVFWVILVVTIVGWVFVV